MFLGLFFDESYLRCFCLCFKCLKFLHKIKIIIKTVLITSISILLKIYELPEDPPKLQLVDALAGLFEPEAYDILDEQYLNRKQQEDAAL